MNIIAVDDEPFALNDLGQAITRAVPDCILSRFTRPERALRYAEKICIDIAFLAIEMGGINGLELAKRLKGIYSKTNIVFVTGSSHYAVDSYSIPASGYIVKPVTERMILDAMEHLRNPIADGKRLRVQCFGNFEAIADGKPVCL